MQTSTNLATPQVQAMLISLTFSFGKSGGEDKELTKKICGDNNASSKALKATKKIICKEAMDPLKKHASEWRSRLAMITTKWDVDSMYLCKAINVAKAMALETEYSPKLEVLKNGHLIERLPEWKEMTKVQLGDRYIEAEFPTEAQMREISWSMHLMPLPESEAIRRISDIDEGFMATLMTANDARVAAAVREGMMTAYQRLMDPIQHMVNVLSSDTPKKIMETLVTNVTEMIDEIPGLNFTNDPDLTRFADEARQLLSTISPETLRDESVVIRQETAQRAADILASFGATGVRKFSL